MEAERENVDAREAATYACADARRRWREIEGRWMRGRSGGCEGAMEGEREKAGAREAVMCVCVCACAREQMEIRWMRGRHRSVRVHVPRSD